MNNKKDFIWNFIGITTNAFISLFFLILVNRINGIEEAGIFSYNFAVVCLFYIIATFFNRTYQISNLKNKYSNNTYITTRLVMCVITIIITILFGILNNFSSFKFWLLLFLMSYRCLEAVADCFYAFIQKKNQLYYVGKSLFFKTIVGILLFAICDYVTYNLLFALIWIIITNLVGLIFDINRYNQLYHKSFKFDFSKTNKILLATFPIFLFSFLGIFLCNCQKYVLNYFLAEKYQTIFGIIIMPATMLSLCGQYILNPYLNELSNLFYKNEQTELKSKINKINLIFIGLGLLILIIAFVLGIPVLNLVYSINLNNYKQEFMIIIVGALFYGLGTIISSIFTIIDKNIEQLYIYIVSSILSLFISVIFIKNVGIMGASIAYMITMLFHFLLSYFLMKKYLRK